MQRIEGQLPDEDELAKQVLSWIICAKRPLTTAELQHALAVEAGDSRFDIENLSQVEDMVAVCAGLVTVDEESRIIRLVHYTTQQYFERTQQKWFPNAEADITRICVTYLSFDLFKIGFCHTDAQFEERLQVHKLYEYAAKNWGHHARLASVPYHEVADFLECESKLEASTQALIAEKRSQGNSNYSQRFPQKMRGLHIAAYFGIREVAYALVDKGHLDIRDSYSQTPLLLAAGRGHATVVNMLVENQADVNAQGGHYGNALVAASDDGHEAIVRLLLEHQADVNAQKGYYGNALIAASAKGHEAIVRLLLEHQADVNAQGGFYGNALQAASANGHEAIIRLLLLEHQADVNAQGGYYGNALIAASDNGHEAIVKRLLLEHQADVNTQGGGRYGNALVAASAKGHEAIVRLLLEHQADVNAQGGRYGNALVAASANGWETVAKQLIATAGVDVNLKDAIGRVPLAYAAMRGHRVVVTTLLNNECVDADHRDYYGATPLSLAARHCHTAVVKLLLATRRVDINSQDSFGHTPLWWARNTECAEILLKYAELNDITVCRSDIHTEVGSLPNDGTVIWCDVCTLNIQDGDVYYCCGVCSGGDFDICSVCYTIGGRCLEPRHELLEQK
ncbi:ankyrin repeat-containing domain protein [Bisporella sp. PMI_857]|nr:ankyrin repeat-containing domain protein [Bisporella sp. PMI_857]